MHKSIQEPSKVCTCYASRLLEEHQRMHKLLQERLIGTTPVLHKLDPLHEHVKSLKASTSKWQNEAESMLHSCPDHLHHQHCNLPGSAPQGRGWMQLLKPGLGCPPPRAHCCRE